MLFRFYEFIVDPPVVRAMKDWLKTMERAKYLIGHTTVPLIFWGFYARGWVEGLLSLDPDGCLKRIDSVIHKH